MAGRLTPPRLPPLPPLDPNWRMRRRVILTSLAFCAGVIVYVLAAGLDSRVAESAVNGAYLLMGAVIGSYVFGAVWEDRKDGRQRIGMDSWEREGDRDWPRGDGGHGPGGVGDPDHREPAG